jgi:hypothetical protein
MKIREEMMKKVQRKKRLWIVTNSAIGEETDTILRKRKYE